MTTSFGRKGEEVDLHGEKQSQQTVFRVGNRVKLSALGRSRFPRAGKEFGLVVAVLVGLQVFILVREANAAGVNCSYKTLLSAMPRHWLRTSRP